MEQTVNKIIAQGQLISTSYRNELGYNTITLLVKDRRANNRIFLHFVLPYPLDPDIKLKDTLIVTGYTRVYAFREAVTRKYRTVQYFQAEKVHKAPTEMEEYFGIKGRFYKQDYVRAIISGRVVSASKTAEKWGRLVIRADENSKERKPSNIAVGYYESSRMPKFDFNNGDEVCLYASIFSTKKEKDGQPQYYENLIVEDLVITKKATVSENGGEEMQTAVTGEIQNIFDYIQSEEDISGMANVILEGKELDEYWENEERNLLTSIVGYLFHYGTDSEKNTEYIIKLLDNNGFALDVMFSSLSEECKNNRYYAKYLAFKESPEKTRTRVLLSATAHLKEFRPPKKGSDKSEDQMITEDMEISPKQEESDSPAEEKTFENKPDLFSSGSGGFVSSGFRRPEEA